MVAFLCTHWNVLLLPFHVAPASPPQNVTATVLSPTEIQVNWTGVLKRDQNGIITQYEVKYKPLMTFSVLPILTSQYNKLVCHACEFGGVCGVQHISESLHQCGTWTIQYGDYEEDF